MTVDDGRGHDAVQQPAADAGEIGHNFIPGCQDLNIVDIVSIRIFPVGPC